MNQADLIVRMEALRGTTLHTPGRRKPFAFARIEHDRVIVATSNASEVQLPVAGIQAVLDYLARHGHGRQHPCPIKSSNDVAEAGPLCVAARAGGAQRKITYVLPILERLGLVGFDRSARAMAVFLVDEHTKPR